MSLLIDIGLQGRLAVAESGSGSYVLLTYTVKNDLGTDVTVFRNVSNSTGQGLLTDQRVLDSAGSVVNVM